MVVGPGQLIINDELRYIDLHHLKSRTGDRIIRLGRRHSQMDAPNNSLLSSQPLTTIDWTDPTSVTMGMSKHNPGHLPRRPLTKKSSGQITFEHENDISIESEVLLRILRTPNVLPYKAHKLQYGPQSATNNPKSAVVSSMLDRSLFLFLFYSSTTNQCCQKLIVSLDAMSVCSRTFSNSLNEIPRGSIFDASRFTSRKV